MKDKWRVKLTMVNGDEFISNHFTEELQKEYYESLKNQL
jgi:hypothetical protein